MRFSIAIVLMALSFSVVYSQPREVTLADDILLSSAQIVANAKYLGILDSHQRTFLLYDHQTGKYITHIDARDSFPGFNWAPIRPKLLANEIFFTNSAPWGVYVSYDNRVRHVAGSSFLATAAFDFINDSLYVGLFTRHDWAPKLQGVDRDGSSVLEFQPFSIPFPNLAFRSEMSHLVYHDGRVYMIPSYTNTMYVFDLQGRLVENKVLEIKDFVVPSRDKRLVLSGSFEELSREVIEVTRGRSYVSGLYVLNESELLLISELRDQTRERMRKATRYNTRMGVFESRLISNSGAPLYAYDNKVYFLDLFKEPLTVVIRDIADYWSELEAR